jgi:hypothetical protein
MIVVKIEIWPFGNEEKAKEITRAYIANDGKTSSKTNGVFGSYDVRFMQSEQYNPKKVWKKGRAENVHRKKRGVWDILYLCLKSIGMEKRNKENNDCKETIIKNWEEKVLENAQALADSGIFDEIVKGAYKKKED